MSPSFSYNCFYLPIMLKHLSVVNYALIEKLEMDFCNGFSVITGETGAGKSILLGALGLVLGNRAEIRVLSDKTKKCIVEAIFDISEYHLQNFFEKHELDYENCSIVRREILPSGKSRAFINDSPVKLHLLKELGESLMDIHSQHETLNLSNGEFQLQVLDGFSKIKTDLKIYQRVFTKYKQLVKKYDSLTLEEERAQQEKDFLQFQFDELVSADLVAGEQSELEQEREFLSNASAIKEKLYAVDQLLTEEEMGLVNQLKAAVSYFKEIGEVGVEYKELMDRLESMKIEIEDVSFEIDRLSEDVKMDPERLLLVEDRLDLIYKIQQKHRLDSIEALLELKGSLEDKLLHFSSLGEMIESTRKDLDICSNELNELAKSLSQKRRNGIEIFQDQIQSTVRQLGMNEASFVVQLTNLDNLNKFGRDEVKFLFTANRGSQPLELSKAASGGEMSRVMLAIKSLVAESSMMPTILFDEIDTGISGEVAGKVGDIMKLMAMRHQIIAITHLPQIAGKGNTHYYVYKKSDLNSTKSNIRLLTKDERITELAKMLSNEKISDAAIVTAKELLAYD